MRTEKTSLHVITWTYVNVLTTMLCAHCPHKHMCAFVCPLNQREVRDRQCPHFAVNTRFHNCPHKSVLALFLKYVDLTKLQVRVCVCVCVCVAQSKPSHTSTHVVRLH